jgi:hypothetical protein
MASIIIVKKADLPKTPEAFQQYVKDYFLPRKVFGEPCMVAQAHVIHPTSPNGWRKGIGLAPAHSCELSVYTGGLKKGESVGDWIRKNTGKLVEELYVTESSRNTYYVD